MVLIAIKFLGSRINLLDHDGPRMAAFSLPSGCKTMRFLSSISVKRAGKAQHNFTAGISTGRQTAAGYISQNHESPRAVYRMNVSTRRVEPVADFTHVAQGPFIFGGWIGLGPDDSPLAVENLTTENIYAWDFEAK